MLVPGVMQDFVVLLIEFDEVPVSPFLQHTNVLLDGSMILCCYWFSFPQKKEELCLCHHVTAYSRHVFNLHIQTCGGMLVFTWSLTNSTRLGAKVFPDRGL